MGSKNSRRLRRLMSTIPSEVWVRIASMAPDLRVLWAVTATCRSAHQARLDPSLPAAWLVRRHKGGHAALRSIAGARNLPDAAAAEIVVQALRMGAAPNPPATDKPTIYHHLYRHDNYSALATAARRGHAAVASALLRGGAAPNVPDSNGQTALIAALHHGQVHVMQVLLAAGASPNAVLTGQAPLECAAGRGDAASVVVLLAAGADPNAARSPLVIAVHENALDIVEVLLAAGADPNIASMGETALTAACMVRCADICIVDALLAARANVNAADAAGRTALMLAIECQFPGAAEKLLAAGASPNGSSSSGTALTHACENQDTDLVAALLAAGADPDAAGEEGHRALSYAVFQEDTACMELLLRSGADVNAACTLGWTALRHAAWVGKTRMVRALLAAGADPNASGSSSNPLLDEPEGDRSEGWTPLMHACQDGRRKMVRALLAAGAEPNAANDDGQTPLMLAIPVDTPSVSEAKERTAVVEMLLAAGAKPNTRDREYRTAWNRVGWRGGFPPMREALKRAGAKCGDDPNWSSG